ncbi:hypothetical protein [Rufibacter roseus]|uniref:hypothetical protein n=1 Tax=Rufibacter roseus TaxID=1567108 RepID=UPI00083795A3|nr:hypothetical protein [Rufibacter roseus]
MKNGRIPIHKQELLRQNLELILPQRFFEGISSPFEGGRGMMRTFEEVVAITKRCLNDFLGNAMSSMSNSARVIIPLPPSKGDEKAPDKIITDYLFNNKLPHAPPTA